MMEINAHIKARDNGLKTWEDTQEEIALRQVEITGIQRAIQKQHEYMDKLRKEIEQLEEL